ncbi:MAG: ABC transporter substrate-binding protein [Synergistaceae bacterium]|nr:ABC transporter substrate-binding protein [Synergistaceae bacterium]
MDPIHGNDNSDIWVCNLVVQGLTKSSADGTKVEPELAERWDVSPDGITYTFYLKEGVKFSDGTPVTTDDWIYSYERLITSKESVWTDSFSMIDKVTATGDNTLRFKLKAPSPFFLAATSMFCASVMPKAYCEKVGDDGIAQNPIGTGPFMLESWNRGEKLVFAKNPYYWKEGLPKADKIIFNVVPDDNTKIMQLQAGQVDVITYVPFNRTAELSVGRTKVYMPASTYTSFISVNNSLPELSDPNVRKALLYAIDRDAINKVIYNGKAALSTGLISPALPHYNSQIKPLPYDLEKAKELMSKSAYPDGFQISLTFTSGNFNELQMAVMIKEAWSKIGVALKLEQLDSATVWSNWGGMKYQSLLNALTSDIADPTQFGNIAISALGRHCYRSDWSGPKQQEAEIYAVKANSEMDPAKRAALYAKVQELYNDDLPLLPMFYVPYVVASSKSVTGFEQNPLGVYNFELLSK